MSVEQQREHQSFAQLRCQECDSTQLASQNDTADLTTDLHEGNALLGLLVKQGDALLKALLIGLPGLQQLSLPSAVCILDGSWYIHVLHTCRVCVQAGQRC